MTTSLDILVRARDEASGVMNHVKGSAVGVDKALTNSGKSASKVGGIFHSTAAKVGGMIAAGYAVKQAFDFGASAIKNAEDAKRSTDAFNAALNRTGQAATINTDKFNDWALSFGEAVGQDDEDLRDLATTLASTFDFRKLSTGATYMSTRVASATAEVQRLADAGKKGTKEYADAVQVAKNMQDSYNQAVRDGGEDATKYLEMATGAIEDVAAATHKSPGLIKKMFASLLNDPAAAVTQLKKLGVITDAQADHFKKMAEGGAEAATSQKLLTMLSEKYKGAAAANSTASERLSIIWNNMKEALGNFLLPIFEKVVAAVSSGVQWFRDLADKVRAGTSPLAKFATAGKFILGIWQDVFGLNFTFFDALKTEVQGAIDVVQGLIDGGKMLWSFIKGDLMSVVDSLSDTFKNNLLPAWESLVTAFTKAKPFLLFIAKVLGVIIVLNIKLTLKALGILIRVLGFVIQVVAQVVESFVTFVSGIVRLAITVGHALGDVANAFFHVRDIIFGVWDRIISFFGGLGQKMAHAASGMWNWLTDGLKSAVNGVVGLLNWIIGKINAFKIPSINVGPVHTPGWDGLNIPPIPTLRTGGEVMKTGFALVHEGETFSGVGNARRRGRVEVKLDRRRFTEQLEWDAAFGSDFA